MAYLPFITTAAGGGADQYNSVDQRNGKVSGYGIALPDGTSLAVAEQFLAKQLPPDAKLVNTFKGNTAGGDGACLFLNYQSATLATVLGSDGTVGATLYTVPANAMSTLEQTFDPNNINSGNINGSSAQCVGRFRPGRWGR